MKCNFIFHGRFPSEKAASLFVAKSAEAFSRVGLDVILIVPKRRGYSKIDSFEYYNIKNNFEIVYLPTIDLYGVVPDKIAFWLSLAVFSVSTFFFINKKTDRESIVYSNEIVTLSLISFIRSNCFYEMHDFPESKLSVFNYFLNRMRWILVHNKWKLEEIFTRFPLINKSKILYEPNAVDTVAFDINISTSDARNKLELPINKKIIVYTGHLYGWKGVDTLAKSMSRLTSNYLAVFVGGTEQDIKIFKDKYSKQENILIVGFKKHNEIPLWQKASDILVLPNTAKEAISAYYTSPMKLYEYMASKRLIIASDIPSVREIISDTCAVFFNPDDEEDLAKKIIEVCSIDQVSCNLFINNAFELVTKHTWDKRAGRIINFINEKI